MARVKKLCAFSSDVSASHASCVTEWPVMLLLYCGVSRTHCGTTVTRRRTASHASCVTEWLVMLLLYCGDSRTHCGTTVTRHRTVYTTVVSMPSSLQSTLSSSFSSHSSYSSTSSSPYLWNISRYDTSFDFYSSLPLLLQSLSLSLHFFASYCTHRELDEQLPLKSDTQYKLKKRRHSITLPQMRGHLAARNFIVRLLYKETYWLPSQLFP